MMFKQEIMRTPNTVIPQKHMLFSYAKHKKESLPKIDFEVLFYDLFECKEYFSLVKFNE